MALRIADRARREQVIALHCSGSGAGQWRRLGEALGDDYELVAPEHYGCDSVGPWTGQHAFTLADEAARTIALIDETDRAVHLVGHSYGGGVALHVALARPDRIASLSLYEPSAFYLLKQIEHGAAPFTEIEAVANTARMGVLSGDYRTAAIAFIDYWSGRGAWHSLRPVVQDAIVRWMPMAPLGFAALFEEPTPASAFAQSHFPALIIRGEHAPPPTRLIAQTLPSLFPSAHLKVVAGAGHMGAITHAGEVNALIVRHVEKAAARVMGQQIGSLIDEGLTPPRRFDQATNQAARRSAFA